jgi:hypothetical protein
MRYWARVGLEKMLEEQPALREIAKRLCERWNLGIDITKVKAG